MDLLKYFICIAIVIVLVCCLAFLEPKTITYSDQYTPIKVVEVKKKVIKKMPQGDWNSVW